MIASLMMYNRAELEAPIARYWALIRHELAGVGIASPAELTQKKGEFSVWEHPDLIFSQTCGLPYRTRLHNRVTMIGTPDFGVSDCPAGYYRSVFLVRRDETRQTLIDFKSSPFAYNQRTSQSGFAAAYNHTKSHGFWFENRVETGAHWKSAQMLANKDVEIAILDAVTWRLIKRYEDYANDFKELEWTVPTPGLLYISGLPQKMQPALYSAVEQAIENLTDTDRDILGLKSLTYIAPNEYLAIPTPPQEKI